VKGNGAPCDDPDGVAGILSYRNECNFSSKNPEDNGNQPGGPDMVEPDQTNQSMANSGSNGFEGQAWLSPDQGMPVHDGNGGRGLPMQGMVLTPTSGSLYEKAPSSGAPMAGFVQSESSGDTNDISVSPDGPQSSRPTPNSSTASEPRHTLTSTALNGSGGNSFEASPVSSHQNLASQVAVDGTGAYFTDSGFSVGGARLTANARYSVAEPTANSFQVPNGWPDLPVQNGMTPVAEGVLRSLMSMGPMDAMDLSTWDSGA
jgi:hypothetical protein